MVKLTNYAFNSYGTFVDEISRRLKEGACGGTQAEVLGKDADPLLCGGWKCVSRRSHPRRSGDERIHQGCKLT